MARTKLTSHVKKAIIEAVEMGVPPSKVSPAVGVSRRTFDRWVARGSNPQGVEDALFVSFVQDLEEAEARFLKNNVERVAKAAETDPEQAKWLLERRYPSDFGKRVELEVGPSRVLLALQEQARMALEEDSKSEFKLTGTDIVKVEVNPKEKSLQQSERIESGEKTDRESRKP